MASTPVCASSVDLIERHRIDGVHVPCITDVGQGMAVDRRVVPEGQVAAIVAGVHDAGCCVPIARADALPAMSWGWDRRLRWLRLRLA